MELCFHPARALGGPRRRGVCQRRRDRSRCRPPRCFSPTAAVATSMYRRSSRWFDASFEVVRAVPNVSFGRGDCSPAGTDTSVGPLLRSVNPGRGVGPRGTTCDVWRTGSRHSHVGGLPRRGRNGTRTRDCTFRSLLSSPNTKLSSCPREGDGPRPVLPDSLVRNVGLPRLSPVRNDDKGKSPALPRQAPNEARRSSPATSPPP
jgi:hypothetical protein